MSDLEKGMEQYPDLLERQKKFIAVYAETGSKQIALKKAGYSEKTASHASKSVSENPKVKETLNKIREEALKTASVGYAKVLRKLEYIADLMCPDPSPETGTLERLPGVDELRTAIVALQEINRMEGNHASENRNKREYTDSEMKAAQSRLDKLMTLHKKDF